MTITTTPPPSLTRPQTVLLNNVWTAFFSGEPIYQYRATFQVSFPTQDSIHFTSVAHFSELGLGDDVTLAIDSPIVLDGPMFVVPATLVKSATNAQGSTASLKLTGQEYGFAVHWGNRVMSMLGRDYHILGQ